jgi:hypothetical protein
MDQSAAGSMGKNHYIRLLAMTVLSFIAMFVLMYAMVDRFANVYANLNQFYMAALMTAAMVIIELLLMSGMYPNRRLNAVLIVVSIGALTAFWFFTREQTAISDRQFLRSMIPHHAGAILMCNEAQLADPRLQQLCRDIVEGQQKEIDLMTEKLRELDR